MATQPWRGYGPTHPGRPAVPVPPERMPLLRGGRPLKAWTYVGAYGPELMLCAARARIAGVPIAWWAVWDRASGRLVQGRRGVDVGPRRVAVRGRLELTIDDGAAIEVVSPHGSEYAWTRKRAARARGRYEGRPIDLPAIVDESAGYHARHTAWRWSAGAGTLATGEDVAWNLVDGIHDAPEASERTVWVAGVPREVGPVAFADDLAWVAPAADEASAAPAAAHSGPALRFAAEATRARRENLLLVRSDYEQPFGVFSGELPGAGALREGWGVMERHDVHW
jgi:hypothetical protein